MGCEHLAQFRREMQNSAVGRVETSPRVTKSGLVIVVDESATAPIEGMLEEHERLVQLSHDVEETGLHNSSNGADHHVIDCTECDTQT